MYLRFIIREKIK